MIAAPLPLSPAWPIKRPEPAALQMRPGISPRSGGCAVAHAPSTNVAAIAALRINGFAHDHAAHLELAVLDAEGEAAFDEIERVLAELLVAPPRQDVEVLADA